MTAGFRTLRVPASLQIADETGQIDAKFGKAGRLPLVFILLNPNVVFE